MNCNDCGRDIRDCICSFAGGKTTTYPRPSWQCGCGWPEAPCLHMTVCKMISPNPTDTTGAKRG